MPSEPKPKKTKVMTFRLPTGLVDKLTQEIEEKNVHMNNHVTQILSSHVELHSPAFAVGMFLFPKRLVRSMLEKLDDEIIEELGRQMAQNDFVRLGYMDHAYDAGSFIDLLLTWAKHSGFSTEDRIYGDDDSGGGGNTRTLIIKHDMGGKWSLFMSNCLKDFFDQLEVKVVEFEAPGDMLVVKIHNWQK